MNELHLRILSISNKLGLAHRGSCLTAVNIIDEIYTTKKGGDPFILSCGHSGLALYVVLEKYYGLDAEELYHKHGTHPTRDWDSKIWCSTGSLGHGLPIAVGMAIADRKRDIYCLISDGESMEGSIYESANIIRKYNLTNLKLYLNFNGWTGYDKVETWMLHNLMVLFPFIELRMTRVEDYNLQGLSAHYVTS